MTKKQIQDKLNSQKGVTGADIVIALLIILTTVGVIGMVYTNLVIGSKEVDRKTGATRIATNVLENLSQLTYDEISEFITDSSKTDYDSSNETYTVKINKIFETTVPNGYTVVFKIEPVCGKNTDVEVDILKKITVSVKYNVGNIEKKVELEKVFARETIRECNSPNLELEYIETIATGAKVYSENNSSKIIICPVKYDKAKHKYVIVDENERSSMWYSYSNKQWARVLAIPSEDIDDYINENNEVIDSSILTSDMAYVWIPRFGFEQGSSTLSFKYKNTDYAIKCSDSTEEGFIYNYLDNQEWSENSDIDFSNLYGKWCKYEELEDNNSVAYYLKHSQYGPILEE